MIKHLAGQALHYLYKIEDKEGYVGSSPVSKCIDYLQKQYIS